jgi:molecular chaperone DnaK
MSINLTKAKLEQLCIDLLEKSLEPCRQALKDAGLTTSQITDVILVGGSTRMPKVQELVRQFFNKEPMKGINPDEAVALGAAIQAGVLKGDVREVLLLDVTPLTLSIETLGGVATPLIPRNTTIPTSKSQIFSTAADNQPSVEINVLQGERPMAADNRSLGRFMLDGILPAPRGVPQIEVTFDIDANGILNVRAQDKGTGKEQKITITASSGLSKEEVDKLARDAEAHAAEDAKKREEIEARNEADSLIYTVERVLREQGDKVPADLKSEIEGKVSAARSALQSGNVDQIKSSSRELSELMQKIGASVYQQQAGPTEPPPGAEGPPPPGQEGGEGGGAGEEGTVEGEFREV